MEDPPDEYFYDDYDQDEQDDTDDTDKDDEDEEQDDEDEDQVDLLYRCGCKWKGADPCSAAFEDEEAMWQHLIDIHHTSKWIVKVYSRIH